MKKEQIPSAYFHTDYITPHKKIFMGVDQEPFGPEYHHRSRSPWDAPMVLFLRRTVASGSA